MSAISSLGTSTGGVQSLGAYERNAKTYGAAVASVIGAADALGSAASATVNISSDALAQAGQALSEGVDEVVSTATEACDAVGSAMKKAYGAVAEAGSDAADLVGDVVSTMGDYATAAAVGAGQALDWVA